MNSEDIDQFMAALYEEMNSEYVHWFVAALIERDDASALSLLENGGVTIDSVYFAADRTGVLHALPVLFVAVEEMREKIVLALVRLGASIDSVRHRVRGSGLHLAGQSA